MAGDVGDPTLNPKPSPATTQYGPYAMRGKNLGPTKSLLGGVSPEVSSTSARSLIMFAFCGGPSTAPCAVGTRRFRV